MHQRRSIRKYQEGAIPEETLRQMMEAPLLAPSSKRSTPWEFILVDDPQLLEQLGQCRAANSAFAAKAQTVVVVAADTEKTDVWVEDASIAAAYLQLQVEELGYGSCWVQVRQRFTAGDESAEAYVRRVVGLPERFGVLCLIAIGRKAEEKKPFDDARLQWNKLHRNGYGTEPESAGQTD